MAERKVIAVLGATGIQGGGLCRAILADSSSGLACRAVTRDPTQSKAQALAGSGAQVVQADLDDVSSLQRALAGAHGVYAVTNFWESFSAEREKAQVRNIAEAARAADVQHIIWSTLEDTRVLMKPDDARMPFLQEKYRVPHFDAKAEADAFFAGLPVTYLVTSFYWDNLYNFGMAPKKDASGRYAWTFPMGNSRLAGIAGEDIGRTALGVFKGGNAYVGQRLGIVSEALAIEEMGRTLSKALGIGPIQYNAVPADAYRKFDFPGADELGNMFQVYDQFEREVLAARSQETTRRLNPQLQTFEQFAIENSSRIMAAMQS